MPPSLWNIPRKPLGESSLSVPIFGLGGAHLGEYFARVPGVQARRTVEAAWNIGVRFFDTAPWYGHGLSEHRLGEVLRQKLRDKFVLATKVGRVYGRPRDMRTYSTAPWKGGLPFELQFDYSYDGVMRSYEQSLMRLGLSTVDALAIHDLNHDYHTDIAEFQRHCRALESGGFKALQELKAAGDIRAIGAGISKAGMMSYFLDNFDLDYLLVAMPYTLLDQAAIEPGGGFDRCKQRNVSVVIGSPFASGILADPQRHRVYDYAPADSSIVEKVRRIGAVCADYSVPLPAAALQFVLAHPVVASVIPGAVSEKQVRENARYLRMPIPQNLWEALRRESLIDPAAPTPH